MEKRINHESLVPRWVRSYANTGPYGGKNIFGHILPAWHGGLVENVMWHVGQAFLALFIPWLIGRLVSVMLVKMGMIEARAAESMVFSGYHFVLPSYLLVVPPFMRFLAYRWLARTWERITGERRSERRWYVTDRSINDVHSVLTDLASRVRSRQVKDTLFHVARDIAALRGCCPTDLRIRDLVQ